MIVTCLVLLLTFILHFQDHCNTFVVSSHIIVIGFLVIFRRLVTFSSDLLDGMLSTGCLSSTRDTYIFISHFSDSACSDLESFDGYTVSYGIILI